MNKNKLYKLKFDINNLTLCENYISVKSTEIDFVVHHKHLKVTSKSICMVMFAKVIPEFSELLMSTTFTLHRIFYCVARTWVVIGCQHNLLLLERLF